jgi:predicted PurR-regulated permease PerM
MKSAIIYFSVVVIGLLFVSSAPSSTIPQIEVVASEAQEAQRQLGKIKDGISRVKQIYPTSFNQEISFFESSRSPRFILMSPEIRDLSSVQLSGSDSNPVSQAKSFKEKCQIIEALIMKEKAK